jgi:tRNA-splicing endonuclease subunit Sen2
MTLPQLWLAFQEVHHPLPLAELSLSSAGGPRFDNPFLVNYVAYHHYRALGWVVKGGIKFCVDLLLYKRGPVFSHAE